MLAARAVADEAAEVALAAERERRTWQRAAESVAEAESGEDWRAAEQSAGRDVAAQVRAIRPEEAAGGGGGGGDGWAGGLEIFGGLGVGFGDEASGMKSGRSRRMTKRDVCCAMPPLEF